jgi:hypothetical protein
LAFDDHPVLLKKCHKEGFSEKFRSTSKLLDLVFLGSRREQEGFVSDSIARAAISPSKSNHITRRDLIFFDAER